VPRHKSSHFDNGRNRISECSLVHTHKLIVCQTRETSTLAYFDQVRRPRQPQSCKELWKQQTHKTSFLFTTATNHYKHSGSTTSHKIPGGQDHRNPQQSGSVLQSVIQAIDRRLISHEQILLSGCGSDLRTSGPGRRCVRAYGTAFIYQKRR
jgi:hypothetical protein